MPIFTFLVVLDETMICYFHHDYLKHGDMWLYIGHNHFAEPSVTMDPRKVVYTDRQQKSTHKTKLFLMETLPSKIVFFSWYPNLLSLALFLIFTTEIIISSLLNSKEKIGVIAVY